MRPVLFLFLDGVGLGSGDADSNPFAAARTPRLAGLVGGPLTDPLVERGGEAVVRRLDARLGHPGLPQSATGQATLLTGLNCADAMNGHYGPWPGPTIHGLLAAGTLFRDALGVGGAKLANAYPADFFRALERGSLRPNVPVAAALKAGLVLGGPEEYARGEAIPADLTGAGLAGRHPSFQPAGPAEMGARLARLARRYAFTFFDVWPTDRLGHRGTLPEAIEFVERLDAFVGGVLDNLDEATLLITSDHGNLEDMGSRSHTTNPVPLVAAGPAASSFSRAAGLADVAPAIRSVWS